MPGCSHLVNAQLARGLALASAFRPVGLGSCVSATGGQATNVGSGVKIVHFPTGIERYRRVHTFAGVMELNNATCSWGSERGTDPFGGGQDVPTAGLTQCGVPRHDEIAGGHRCVGGIERARRNRQSRSALAKPHRVQRPVSVRHREPRTSLAARRMSAHRCGTLAISQGVEAGHCLYAGHIGSVTHT